jgi:RNA polymerase II subunit A-like phosphatase
MTHDADGPTVSPSVAAQYDRETSQRLLSERKLSLIVDLDQTIVHATVDPTVGEWMEEAELFKKNQQAREAAKEGMEFKPDDTTEDDMRTSTPEGDVEEPNPNWSALSDVKRFRLSEGQPPSLAKAQEDGTYYYIKPRCAYVTLVLQG